MIPIVHSQIMYVKYCLFHFFFLQQISQQTVEDNKLQHNRDLARKIDKASRVVFPLLFVIFNGVYWTYYMA